MLRDEEAERIEAQMATADRASLARWLKALLEDRRARNALLLGLARRLVYLRTRMRQAADYLDGLVLKAEDEVRAPWPNKLPCPRCGAPLASVRAEQRHQGHAVVHDHPDGKRCAESEKTTIVPRPSPRSPRP